MGIEIVGTKILANLKDCGTLQSIGGIKQKRNVKEYDPANADDIILAVGKIKTAPMVMSVIYDPSDANGAGELETAFKAGAAIPFSMELSNKETEAGKGTTFTWNGAVISDFELNPDEDGFMLASFTATLNGAPAVVAAT